MYEKFQLLRQSRPIRYLFIGGISYIIEMSVLLFLANILSFSPEIAVACSFWVGLGASFVLQKYVAFKSTGSDKRTFGTQAFLYGVLVLFNYGFTILFVSLLAGPLGLVTARTLALLFTVCWNYFIYKRIFKTQ